MTERESMEFDVVIVGGGPAGLSAAYRLKTLAQEKGLELSICVLEKGSEIGAHLLSGAVLEPRALNELIPDWRDRGAPCETQAKKDYFYYLTQSRAFRLPTPPQMHNHGNFIISLSQFGRWLATQCESVGVEIYPGFAAAKILYNEDGRVVGVATGDMGVGKNGQHKPGFQPGMNLLARYTLFAEGVRGSLSQEIIQKFDLRQGKQHQTYGMGIKEVWEISKDFHNPGCVVHTIGWPMDQKTYGGSFIYHMGQGLVSLGFVIGLDYENPYLNPYQEFQRFKTHPKFRPMFESGKRLAYGAKTLNEGGYQSIPQLVFPGGAIIGCSAGFLNVPKIKGIHGAMKSGMLAAEAVIRALDQDVAPAVLSHYPAALQKSWIWKELRKARNIRPSFRWGLWGGLMYAALDTYIFRGSAPWTLPHHKPDHACLKEARYFNPVHYPKHDGVVTFDLLSSVYLSNTNHEEDQPCHLTLRNPAVPIEINLALYDAPEQRYCPAGVYEVVGRETGHPRLQINAQNCVHCKTCDIKDPTQNIHWVVPEGGGGPNYTIV